MENLFNKQVLFGHINSRQPIVQGQQSIDQMPIKAGHVIYQHNIRGQAIPKIQNDNEKKNYLTDKITGEKRTIGGLSGGAYQDIIGFLDQINLKEIANTNNQAWQVVDANNNQIKNIIMPEDAPIQDYQMSNGYKVKIWSESGDFNIPESYGWMINPLNGIVHFSSNFNPSSELWIDMRIRKSYNRMFLL